WLSPVLRRGKFQWFSGLVARFYLGQHSDSAFVRMMISTHLKSFPGDNAVAEPWLEKLLVYESHLPQENEAAARVSASLAEHRRVQRLLMHYYMANGRTDFDALQTYRRVWNDETPLAKDTLLGLARLLRNGYILNHWALQVYMLAFDNGDQQAVEGIFAAVKWLPATEESRPLLKDAKKVIAGLDRHDPGSLDPNFKPVQQRPVPDDKSRLRHDPGPEFKRALIRIFTSAWAKGAQWAKWFTGTFRNKRLRRALPGGVVVVALVVAAMVGRHFFSRPNEDPITAKTVVAEKISITDPFTIQVAAYLKPEDAQRFVDQLVKNGLDAFWTQARSAKRTWYQVKVSHFADRNGAQRYGQELKSNGLIDDFYVANYEHESRNSQLK
ncbi:MAG: SPOR domain-containing protein, partial [Desulfobacteraceae bacterium]